MKKLIAVLAIVLYVGTMAAPAMQVLSNANIVLSLHGNEPKDKKQDNKSTASTDKQKSEKKDAKCTKDAKKDCAAKCTGEKKSGCCADKKDKK